MGFDPSIDVRPRGALADWAGDLLDLESLAGGRLGPARALRRSAEHQASTQGRGYRLWTVRIYQALRAQ
jgi:hypothetical protein